MISLESNKAPINHVDVPLWEYGSDGWDDSPKLLGIISSFSTLMIFGMK
jgi:hypothetical protein